MHWFIEIIKIRKILYNTEFETLPEDIKLEYCKYIIEEASYRNEVVYSSYIFNFLNLEDKKRLIKRTMKAKDSIHDTWFDVLNQEEKEEYLLYSIKEVVYISKYKFEFLSLEQKIKYVNKFKNKCGLNHSHLLDFWRKIQKSKQRDKKLNQILND